MDKITPPTDNLYKFWAISWLIAGIFCFGYPIYQSDRSWEIHSHISIELIKYRSEVMPLITQRAAVNAEIERYRLKGDKAALERMMDEQKTLESRWLSSSKIIEELETLKRKSTPATDFVLMYTRSWVCGLILSFSMSFLGFFWWWIGFQKYQDMQLEAEAKLAVLRLKRLLAEEEEKYKIYQK